MKKIIISLLLVLLTVCLFVSCAEDAKVATFAAADGSVLVVTKKGNGSSFTINGNEYKFDSITYSSDKTTGMYFSVEPDWNLTKKDRTENIVSTIYSFYANNAKEKALLKLVKDFKDLKSLPTIYLAKSNEFVEFVQQ